MDKKTLRARRRKFAAFLMALVMVIPALGLGDAFSDTSAATDGQVISWSLTIDGETITTGATVGSGDVTKPTCQTSTEPPTCGANGKTVYSLSATYTSLANNSETVTKVFTVTIPATGQHTMEHLEKRDVSCEKDGCSVECYHCTTCGNYYKDLQGTVPETPVITAATGHTLEHLEKRDVSCEKDGCSVECYHCTTCGKYFK